MTGAESGSFILGSIFVPIAVWLLHWLYPLVPRSAPHASLPTAQNSVGISKPFRISLGSGAHIKGNSTRGR
jgi:hypothetical protein